MLKQQIVPVAYYADIIATKCRDLVYSDDSTDGGAPSVSDFSGRDQKQTFDAFALSESRTDHRPVVRCLFARAYNL